MTSVCVTCTFRYSQKAQRLPVSWTHPLSLSKSWFVWVASAKPSQKDFLQSRLFQVYLFSPHFTPYESGSCEKAQLTLHRLGGFKRERINRWPVQPYAGLTSFTTYTFIHGESLLLAAQPLSHMQIESCDFPSGWRSGSSLFVWKLGGKPAFSWSESGFTSSWTPLEGNGIHVAFFWAKQTWIITSSQFSALFFLLLVHLLTSYLFPPEVELPAIHLGY